MKESVSLWKPKSDFQFTTEEYRMREELWRLERKVETARTQLVKSICSRIKETNPFVVSIPDMPLNFIIHETGIRIHSLILDGSILTQILDIAETDEVERE